MDSAQIAITVFTGLTGVGFGAVGAYVALSKNTREAKSQVVTEAATTIELLEKQVALLEKQDENARIAGEKREAEWQKREAEWREERAELRGRISEIERDYRNLVLTVTTMGFCANAGKGCPNYNPGDRRTTP